MLLIKRKQEQIKKQDFSFSSALKKKKKREALFQNVNSKVNPFVYVSKSVKEIKTLEDIPIQIEGLFQNYYELKYILRSKELPRSFRKQLIDVLIRSWEYEYYQSIDDELKDTFERASYNPIKRIYRLKNYLIIFYILLTLISFIFLKQLSTLQLLPKMGTFFKHLNTMLLYTHYHRFAQVFGYLTLFITFYLVIVKVYFDKVIAYSISTKGFLIRERDQVLRKMNPQKKKIKQHLNQIITHNRLSTYPIDKIYDPKTVVKRIKHYGRKQIGRIGNFTNYYNTIILVSKLIRVAHFGLFLYLLVSFLRVNTLFPFN